MARRRRRGAVAEAPAPITKNSVTLNVKSVCGFLQTVRIDQLDGLHQAVTAKLSELGSAPRKRAHDHGEMESGTAPGGNIRGVLRFVESARGDEDIAKLQTLEAVISARYAYAGYTPKHESALT